MFSGQSCWCGNTALREFSADYDLCESCQTLVLASPLDPKYSAVDDEEGFYGKQYYDLFVRDKYGYPSLAERARLDLPERCLHWLKAVLKYRMPPSRVLEIGSAHGAFVALLRWAGFQATGLEMSSSVIRFAQETFDVPMLRGPIESQKISPCSLDIIVLMDVLEHFPSPIESMKHCLSLLKDDGMIIIQTPKFPERMTLQQLEISKSPFLLQLKPEEHIYLFSEKSITSFFKQLNVEFLIFERAIFSHYDMFFVCSRQRPQPIVETEIEAALLKSPSSRMVLALLDLDRRLSHAN